MSYNTIDRIDHFIRNCHLYMRSWKYWHSAMLNGLGLGITTAYDMYLDICEGLLEDGFYTPKPLSYKQFRLLLGTQMCEYNPSKRLLPGDWKMRVCSVQKKKADQPDSPYKKRKRNPDEVVTKQQYENEKKNQQKGKKARFCSLETLLYHQEHKKSEPHEAKCVVCCQNCYTSCSICGIGQTFIERCLFRCANTSSKQRERSAHDKGLHNGKCLVMNSNVKTSQNLLDLSSPLDERATIFVTLEDRNMDLVPRRVNIRRCSAK